MAQIHNSKKRMPVILKPEDESKWLQQEPISHFALPYSVSLVAKPILSQAKDPFPTELF
jgi:putative SOS response-associated peptidase YedK